MKKYLILLFIFISTFCKAQICTERNIPNKIDYLSTSSIISYLGYSPNVSIDYIVDYHLYTQLGSVQNSINYVDSIFKNIQLIYYLDSIQICISSITVYSIPDNFHSSLDSLTFGSARTVFVPKGDAVCLLTPSGYYSGGISWVGGLNQYPYNCFMCGVFGTFQDYPIYSWDIEVTSHECGHCIGNLQHTHACSWNGNNTKIDDCGGDAGYSEGTCPPEPSPTEPIGGGTIMSYCHLRPVGINLSKRFSTQVAESARVYIWNNASGLKNPPCINITTPLPIKLISLTGENERGKTTLNWSTIYESNSWKYLIYKNNVLLGTKLARINSDNLQEYSYIDFDINKELNIYTLWEEDLDGTRTYCGAISISNKGLFINSSLNLNNYNIIGQQLNK